MLYQSLFCPVLLIVGVNRGLNGVINDDFALAFPIVKVFHNIRHADNGCCWEAVQPLNVIQCAFVTLAALHSVEGNHEAFAFNFPLCFDDGEGFLNGFAGGGDVLNDDNPVAILDGAAEQDAGIAVILGLLAVGAVFTILFIQFCLLYTSQKGAGSGSCSRCPGGAC